MNATPTNKRGFFVVMSAVFALLVAGMAMPAGARADMPDQAIADKIDDELLGDAGVISTKIDVTVTNGIATLTGQVNNVLAKERAAKVAKTVKGVRAVLNKISISPTEDRADDNIASDIEAALLADPAADSYEIAVGVDDGVASLTGTVESYEERDLALTVAKGVRGVTDVVDQIVVQYAYDRTDTEIRHDVEQVLNWSTYVDHALIDVAVNDGNVMLSGTVGSVAEKTLTNTLSWVAGVESVNDDALDVERWARDPDLRGNKYADKSEEEIRDAVRAALAHDPRVASFNVFVEVTGHVVTLRGQVDNLKAKRAAESAARHTVGVTHVTNRLKVRPVDVATDAQIADDIRETFLRDVYVERFEIAPVVIDGVAYLYGTVDSRFERNRADDLASRVNGVIEVANYLEVDDDTTYLYDPYVDDGYVDQEDIVGFERRAPYRTDAQIEESIESELWWSPFVDSDDVTVTVENGVARLSGTVDSWSERQAATENAYEGGATLVDNDLDVDYSS